MSEAIKNINWELLRKQKQHLLEVLDIPNSGISPEHKDSLQGILHLLDSIQDEAADEHGVPEEEVFGRTEIRCSFTVMVSTFVYL